jgi:cytochrome c-type biogenesis protein CcmH/NrfG
MTSRQIVFGVVGVIVGFILGYFVATAMRPGAASPPTEVAAAPESGLPQNHPSLADIQKLQDWQRQAEADPRDRQVRILLGNSYYDMKRFDAATRWYEEALRLDPNDPNVTTDLGTCYLYTDNPTRAIELYRKSLQMDPKHSQTLQNLGFALFSTTDFKGAIKTWEELLALHPEYSHKQEILKQIETAKSHLKVASPAGEEKPAAGASR